MSSEKEITVKSSSKGQTTISKGKVVHGKNSKRYSRVKKKEERKKDS